MDKSWFFALTADISKSTVSCNGNDSTHPLSKGNDIRRVTYLS